MPFQEKLPDWHAEGVEPPESKKNTGWEPGERPPAEYWNWQMNRTYKALQELQQKALHKDDVKASDIPIEDASGHFTSDNVEGALNELFTSVSDGKTLVAGAITDKGVPTSPSDTFQKMADNIRAIQTGTDTSDATAVAADILAGRTAYARGQKLTGTMPNRTGHVTGQSISRSGTTLRIRPQAGYYPGDSGNSVAWDDPNWIAENIRQGVSIFGLVGSLIEGKKFASGTVTSQNNTTLEFIYDNGSRALPASVSAYVAVNGLNFTPSLILVVRKGSPSEYPKATLYNSAGLGSYYEANSGKILIIQFDYNGYGTYSGSGYLFRLDGIAAYVTSSGFRLPVKSANQQYEWIAIE